MYPSWMLNVLGEMKQKWFSSLPSRNTHQTDLQFPLNISWRWCCFFSIITKTPETKLSEVEMEPFPCLWLVPCPALSLVQVCDHRFSGHELGQTLGNSEGQGGLVVLQSMGSQRVGHDLNNNNYHQIQIS